MKRWWDEKCEKEKKGDQNEVKDMEERVERETGVQEREEGI